MPVTVSFAAKPTLTGDLVTLRPLTVADVPGVMVGLADADLIRLTGTHVRFTAEQVATVLAEWAQRDDRIDLAIIERATGEHAGEVVLDDLDPNNLSCGFRIGLPARYTDRGLGSEATRLILGHAFDTIGVHRVELEVFASNPRGRRVYEKVGFVYEGTKRQALRWQGEWIDAHVMAMLADDWAAHRTSTVVGDHVLGPVTRLR
jgi:RimJ/RimL family protein N-acetyltransferase